MKLFKTRVLLPPWDRNFWRMHFLPAVEKPVHIDVLSLFGEASRLSYESFTIKRIMKYVLIEVYLKENVFVFKVRVYLESSMCLYISSSVHHQSDSTRFSPPVVFQVHSWFISILSYWEGARPENNTPHRAACRPQKSHLARSCTDSSRSSFAMETPQTPAPC